MSDLLIHEMSLEERQRLATKYLKWFNNLQGEIKLELSKEAVITVPEVFVNSHLAILVGPNPSKAMQPYLNRLIRFKQINS